MGIIKTTAGAAAMLVLTGLAVTGCGGTAPYVKASASPTATATPTAVPPAASAPRPAPSSTPMPQPAPTTAPPALTNPSAVVTQFYQDITDGDYGAAWALGGKNLTGGVSYAQWAAGYRDTTTSISVVTASDWDATTVNAEIDAVQLNGTTKTYTGTYTVINGVIQSASIQETS